MNENELWYTCTDCGADETAAMQEQIERMNGKCRRCADQPETEQEARRRAIFQQGMLGRS